MVSIVCATSQAKAEDTDSLLLQKMDSVRISLITVDPGKEVWNLYGHTAIRFQDLSDGRDLGVNYGVFSFEDRSFIIRFVFGITDYEMGIFPMKLIVDSYRMEERGIREQVLNLTSEDKLAIYNALVTNSRPENIVYRYNYFYDNCTTRARDILVNHLKGKLQFTDNKSVYPSFREQTHAYNEDFLWTRFGNDILLGINADRSTTFEEQQFLPDHLRYDFDHALYNGKPLVKESRWILPQTYNENGHLSPEKNLGQVFSPTLCFLLLLVITVLVTTIEYRKRKFYWGFDLCMMLLSGTAGIILFLMIFSQHPTVRVNLQLLLLNPLPLFMAYPVVRRWRRQQESHWYEGLCIILIALFFLGGIWQDYAEGLYFVALSLLVRVISRKYVLERKKVKR